MTEKEVPTFDPELSVVNGSPPRILLVEDDPEISQVLLETLTECGFAATLAKSASEMDNVLRRERVDLVILDIMLPGEDGLSACRRLRGVSKVPIIILTALDKEIDRVVGLELGADDYIGKPFGSRELVARVRAVLRRTGNNLKTEPVKPRPLKFQGWKLDPTARQLHDPQRVKVQLTGTEFDLLLAFCQNPNRVLSRESLLDLTYCGIAGPIERCIDVHISRIRRKIEADPNDPVLIQTVRLGGYIFTANVEVE